MVEDQLVIGKNMTIKIDVYNAGERYALGMAHLGTSRREATPIGPTVESDLKFRAFNAFVLRIPHQSIIFTAPADSVPVPLS